MKSPVTYPLISYRYFFGPFIFIYINKIYSITLNLLDICLNIGNSKFKLKGGKPGIFFYFIYFFFCKFYISMFNFNQGKKNSFLNKFNKKNRLILQQSQNWMDRRFHNSKVGITLQYLQHY